MTLQPRKLKLLIIDDELSVSPGGYEVPEAIQKLFPVEGMPGIDSWRTAMQFWSAFKGGDVPDIVVADVRFIRDLDSPLSNLFKAEENNIPTGLSHLKTFAVLSRALGQPLGVAIRTMDRGLWERQIKSLKPEDRAMGYLAVQEIGELAAILGDGEQLINPPFDKDHAIDKCLEWFERSCKDYFEDGLVKAIVDYRRHLFRLATSPGVPTLFVRPSQYAHLMGWCKQMAEDPQPLHEQRDVGIELTYRDGRRDLISLVSLFSDFGGITTKTLGAAAFSTEEREQPWKPDDDGRPMIGAFLRSLGSLTDVCKDAAQAVRSYSVTYPVPTGDRPPTLATIKDHYSTLTAGLVVLFQFILIEQNRSENWERNFVEAAWDAKRLRFVIGEKSPDNNLKTALQKLLKMTRDYLPRVGAGDPYSENRETTTGLFRRSELFEEFDEFENAWVERINLDDDVRQQDSYWVKWHFERLVDANVFTCLMKGGEEYYGIAPEWRGPRKDLIAPPVPHHFPDIVETTDGKTWKEPDRIQWLRETLRYGGDYNSIERILAAAFVPSAFRNNSVQLGGLILDEWKSTNLRPFLLEVARQYAGEYLEWPVAKWPMWLQGSGQELAHISGKMNRPGSASDRSESEDLGGEAEEVDDGGILCF